MKKKILFTITAIISTLLVAAQVNFGDKQIIDSPPGATAVFAIDIDNDNDIDVISADWKDNTIAWYENTNGLGGFTQHVVTSTLTGARAVYGEDIDGDGDVDIISASDFSNSDPKIAYFENLDGAGNFGNEQIINTTNVNGANSVYAADLDNDGDIDVLSGSQFPGENSVIAWYENDGAGNFGTQQIILQDGNGVVDILAYDVNDDTFIDVVASDFYGNKIIWYENDGTGNFGEQKNISTFVYWPTAVYVADVDGDGMVDVLSSSVDDYNTPNVNEAKLAWYKNTGNGIFDEQQIITTLADNPKDVHAADIDNDGDIDVLSASRLDNRIAWFENMDGEGSFGEMTTITTLAEGAERVFAADIDNDGDDDVLSAAWISNGGIISGEIAWYENTITTNIKTTKANLLFYPNPSSGIFHLDFPMSSGPGNVSITDVAGKTIYTRAYKGTRPLALQIDLSNQTEGMYFIKIETENGIYTEKILIQ